jgi:hypothetical protein
MMFAGNVNKSNIENCFGGTGVVHRNNPAILHTMPVKPML